MSYQKYHTEALVLRGYDYGEADRVFALFTQEFGLVRARATSVRAEKSKMRYALQPYARVKVSLVRGSRGWRAAGASREAAFPVESESGARVFARTSLLVERLVAGEERNDYLFDTLCDAHEALQREPESVHAMIELMCVARILYTLGYLSPEALGVALFERTSFLPHDFAEVDAARTKILASVNAAIAETQM